MAKRKDAKTCGVGARLTAVLFRVPQLVTLLSIIAAARAIAQPPTIDQVIAGVSAQESRFPGVSAVIHNTHADSGFAASIAKLNSQPLPAGRTRKITGGPGEYDYFSAFNGDKDLMVGGRISTITFDPKSKLEDVLRSERTIDKGDKIYYVEVIRGGTSLANENSKTGSAPGIRDFGWRMPLSLLTLREELSTRRFQVIGELQDPKWGRVIHLMGNWDYVGYPKTVNLLLAPDRDYLIVKCEVDFAGNIDQFRIDSMEKIDGYWIPTDCGSDEGAKATRDIRIADSFKIHDVRIGGLTPAQWRETLTFDKVIDGSNGKKYSVSSTGERFLVSSPVTNNPIKYLWGWLYTASIATLLVLTLGAYVRWKSRLFSNPV